MNRTAWVRWHFFALGLLLLGGAGDLLAQVELRSAGGAGRDDIPVAGYERGRPMYRGKEGLQPLPGGGRWHFMPTNAYAPVSGAIEVYYVIDYNPVRGTSLIMNGVLTVRYDVAVTADQPVEGLYYCCQWIVNGVAAVTRFGSFAPIRDKTESRNSTSFTIDESMRHGHLRAYVFKDGQSLSGMAQEDRGLWPLRAAVDAGNYEQARRLVDGLAGRTVIPQYVLQEIAQSGDAGLLDAALDHMTRHGFKRSDADVLLRAAAGAGKLDCVRVLLRRKADPDGKDNRNDTALHIALRNGDRQLVGMLLDAGANPRLWQGYFRGTAMELAMRRHLMDAARLLEAHKANWPGGKELNNLLGLALEQNWRDEAAYLLEHGANPKADYDGTPLVMIAAGQADGEALRLLMQAGAKLDVTDKHGATPAMMAAWRGARESLGILRKAGASLTPADQDGRTAAAWAVKGKQSTLAAELLQATPLSGAAASRVLEDAIFERDAGIIDLALQQGAKLDPKAKDLDDVLCRVVEDNRVNVLEKAWPAGMPANPTVRDDWNLAGIAQRLERADIYAQIAHALGHEPAVQVPPVAKLPVEVYKRGGTFSPEDVGEEVTEGEAWIDLYIDAHGAPLFPVVRKAVPESMGPAAVRYLEKWRFSALDDQSTAWRRVVVPLKYSRDSFSKGEVIPDWSLDENAAPLPGTPGYASHWAGSGEAQQAVWIRFQISATGKVLLPRVLSSSDSAVNARAMAMVRSWRYQPGRKNNQDVWTERSGILLLPSGLFLPLQGLLPDRSFDGKEMSVPIAWDEAINRRLKFDDVGSGHVRGFAVSRFWVDARGEVRDVVTIAASDPKLAKRIRDYCDGYRFKPAKIDGKPAPVTMTQIMTIGDNSDSDALYEYRLSL